MFCLFNFVGAVANVLSANTESAISKNSVKYTQCSWACQPCNYSATTPQYKCQVVIATDSNACDVIITSSAQQIYTRFHQISAVSVIIIN